jgi:hypothetical protein
MHGDRHEPFGKFGKVRNGQGFNVVGLNLLGGCRKSPGQEAACQKQESKQ